MIAASGDRLLAPDAIETLKRVLIPRALVITPNLPEAAALLDAPIASSETQMREQAERLLALGPKSVLIKGGHGSGAGERRSARRADRVHAASRRSHRDAEHTRHRLHALVGDRGRSRQGPRPGRGGRRRQGLCHRRDRGAGRIQIGSGPRPGRTISTPGGEARE